MKRWSLVMSLIAVLGIGGAFVYGTPLLDRVLFDQSFDVGEWAQADVRERGYMVRDLVSSEALIGKGRAEVIELLGQPNREADNYTSLIYNVDIGYRWPFGPRLYQTVVYFNKAKQVYLVTIERRAGK